MFTGMMAAGTHFSSTQAFCTAMVCVCLFVPLALGGDASAASLAAAAAVPAAVPVPAPVPAPVPEPAAVPASAPVAHAAPAPTPKALTLHEKVVESLRAAGHYGAIAGLLDSLPDNIIKTGITLFAPNDNAFSNVLMNSTTYLETLLSYHVTPKVYSYQALTALPTGTKLQTSAPNVVIVVTSNAKDAYKLDDSLVVNPDIYVDSTVSVHGIDSVLNTAKYNQGVLAPEPAPAPVAASPPAPPASTTPSSAPPAADADAGSPSDVSPEAAPQTTNPNAAPATKASLLSSAAMAMWALLVL